MWQGLLEAANDLADDEEIRVVLLRGEKRLLLLALISANSLTNGLTAQKIKNMTMFPTRHIQL